MCQTFDENAVVCCMGILNATLNDISDTVLRIATNFLCCTLLQYTKFGFYMDTKLSQTWFSLKFVMFYTDHVSQRKHDSCLHCQFGKQVCAQLKCCGLRNGGWKCVDLVCSKQRKKVLWTLQCPREHVFLTT